MGGEKHTPSGSDAERSSSTKEPGAVALGEGEFVVVAREEDSGAADYVLPDSDDLTFPIAGSMNEPHGQTADTATTAVDATFVPGSFEAIG